MLLGAVFEIGMVTCGDVPGSSGSIGTVIPGLPPLLLLLLLGIPAVKPAPLKMMPFISDHLSARLRPSRISPIHSTARCCPFTL